ncbi:ribbon-helix-helix domain-containing protein [Rosistilla oblonga]|uniref:ribbon-helix-helix domain-containing protein n=1 Tax=Rosistilla oblonga TaxID=2527990 RepID=UPI003A977050
MSTISVNVPDQIMSAIAKRARNSGYADVNEYVTQYVLRLSERQSEVEELAIEGLQSGPSLPWDKTEIEDMRAALKSKYGG